jgi:hypothetical protein
MVPPLGKSKSNIVDNHNRNDHLKIGNNVNLTEQNTQLNSERELIQ